MVEQKIVNEKCMECKYFLLCSHNNLHPSCIGHHLLRLLLSHTGILCELPTSSNQPAIHPSKPKKWKTVAFTEIFFCAFPTERMTKQRINWVTEWLTERYWNLYASGGWWMQSYKQNCTTKHSDSVRDYYVEGILLIDLVARVYL